MLLKFTLLISDLICFSVSLILALWNAMTPPFRVLDEFDVFMDALNRRYFSNPILR